MNAVKSKVKGRSVDKKQENQKNKRNRENWRRQRRRQRRRRRRLHLLLTHWSSLSPTRLNSIFNSMKQSPFPFLFFLLFLVDVVDVVAVFGCFHYVWGERGAGRRQSHLSVMMAPPPIKFPNGTVLTRLLLAWMTSSSLPPSLPPSFLLLLPGCNLRVEIGAIFCWPSTKQILQFPLVFLIPFRDILLHFFFSTIIILSSSSSSLMGTIFFSSKNDYCYCYHLNQR